MDALARDGGLLERAADLRREALGTAHVRLAPVDVGDRPAQRGGVERDALARTDELDEPPAEAPDLGVGKTRFAESVPGADEATLELLAALASALRGSAARRRRAPGRCPRPGPGGLERSIGAGWAARRRSDRDGLPADLGLYPRAVACSRGRQPARIAATVDGGVRTVTGSGRNARRSA